MPVRRATVRVVAALSAFVVVAGSSASRLGAAGGQRATGCLPTDAGAESTRRYLVRTISATDGNAEGRRAAWGLDASTDSAAIRFEHDSVVCARSARAHAIDLAMDSTVPAPVHVLRTGANRLMVFNYSTEGGRTVFLLMDTTYAVIKRLIS